MRGRYCAPALVTAVATFALAAPAAADWSGDGAADVLAAHYRAALAWVEQTAPHLA